MAKLTWSDKYAVGVHAIDDEHKELVDTVREIESAMVQSADTGALLQKLVASASSHFADEEAMMRDRKFPGLAIHVANHQRLMEKVEAFAARHGRSGAAVNQHALNFLRDWLLYHIENDDARLGAWLSERKLD